MSEFAKIEMPLEQEGTKSVVRAWLRQVGDHIERDEPLVEIETDKVAVEVAAPQSGVLHEIALDVGAEAEPGAVLGLVRVGKAAPQTSSKAAAKSTPQPSDGTASSEHLSPLVKRQLAQHGLDPREIAGTGRDGRITHEDVIAFLAKRDAKPVASVTAPPKARRVPHNPMRLAIAEHMVRSLAVAPHVTAVFEADFGAVIAHRQRHKADFERAGAPLTFSAYFVRACAGAMEAAPQVNSRWHGDALEIFEDVNVGIGVSLGEKGLVAPVIARAQTLSLQEIARRLNELTQKARAGKITSAETQGGTFTISNHGVSGSLLAAPIIINQPQSAILGIGKLEKRVVVREVAGADAIQIRPMAYVSLSIDHRVIDAHQTNAWLTRFVEILENWPLESA